MIKSFDIIGNILIVEIPEVLKKKEKKIVVDLLLKHKNTQVIFKKIGVRKGKYRTQKLKVLYGKDNPVTVHKESGVKIKLDVKKCYFSPRLSTERLRIAKLIKPKESVLTLFSGVAPYPLVIAKNSQAKEIFGIELNPIAHKYAQENILLNNFSDKIFLYNADVKKIVPRLKKKFDRIIMPLPKTGELFLKQAFIACKKNCMIHLYSFAREEEFNKIKQKILKRCKSNKLYCKLLRIVKAGQTAPRTYRICMDFNVKKRSVQ